MSGANSLLSRPGAHPLIPSTLVPVPTGRLLYLHPAGDSFEVYEVPLSQLCGARAVAPTSGTAQIAGFTVSGTAGASGNVSLALAHPLLSAALAITVAITSGDTASVAAGKMRVAIAAAIAANDEAAALLTSTGSGAVASVTAIRSAANATGFTLTMTAALSLTSAAANTAGVLGTVPAFLGQLAVSGSTVKAATDLNLNTWTTVS